MTQMRKYLLVFSGVLLTLFYACDTDFNTTAPWKEIFVVYGLINPDDAEQYIRIEKGFADASGKLNNIDLAAISDSIYYRPGELTVSLIRLDEQRNTVDSTVLEYVDGNQIGFQKDSGLFSNDPAYLFRFSDPLEFETTYRLHIRNNITGNTAFGECSTVGLMSTTRPETPDSGDIITDRNRTYLTVRNEGESQNADEFVNWRIPDGGEIYDVVLRFFYQEWNAADAGNVTNKDFGWVIANNVTNAATNDQVITESLTPKSFLQQLDSRLVRDPQLRRRMRSNGAQFYFYAGGLEYLNFINSVKAQSGLTLNEANRTFTNLQATGEADVVGIFSSRSLTIAKDLEVFAFVLDSLACSSITRGLNFENADGTNGCN